MGNNRFFTNTYITGSGRQNYLQIKDLEDPLFTSFTFDIDYNTSPLFYTIYDYYNEFKDAGGLGDRIEIALDEMHSNIMEENNQGYDILPVMSSNVLTNGHKLGFGLQQNVYMDKPLYGAVEYIYMVDKRNGGANQNDVRYGNGGTISNDMGENSNSFKLGDSVKTIVNESDNAWAERQKEQNKNTIDVCDSIMNDDDVKREHEENKQEMNVAEEELKNIKGNVDGELYTEDELQTKIDELKKIENSFDQFKREIISWANELLSKYQNDGTNIYISNSCVKEIFSWYDINDNNKTVKEEYLKSKYPNYKTDIISYVDDFKNLYNELINELLIINGNNIYINYTKLNEKFGQKLKDFDINNDANVYVYPTKTPPDWATNLYTHLTYFSDNTDEYKNVDINIQDMMSYQCDMDLSFGEEFTSDKIKENEELLSKFESALDNIKYDLYGTMDNNDYDKFNPDPNSAYGKYMSAKDKYENDEYSQAEKAKEMANSGYTEMDNLINDYNSQFEDNTGSGENTLPNDNQRDDNVINKQDNVPQTVLDMINFISGMKKMTNNYPYVIQGISGLDTAYNKHYGIKDAYLGSGDDKITITCLESIDLRISSMFNRYFNAVYDRQYRRERVPVNLRRFNCYVYVHDVRNFVPNMKNFENKILELKNMYYSVIEFRFYDCEIVPEETGNIFNDISNEAPSEMKKTNFTFTYGNCVVNFVPNVL